MFSTKNKSQNKYPLIKCQYNFKILVPDLFKNSMVYLRIVILGLQCTQTFMLSQLLKNLTPVMAGHCFVL